MCIAIFKPAKTRQITDEELSSCRSNNKDGFGYAFVAYDEVREENFVVVRTFMDYDLFLEKYREDEAEHTETPFLIHFRMNSAGSNSLANCHPFEVNRYTAFIHNGTMFRPPVKETRSDTNIFNADIMQKLPEDWWKSDGICSLLDSFIGYGKVVFLFSDMTHLIFGESRGHWFDGVWWSNNDYKDYRRAPFYTQQAWKQDSFWRDDNKALLSNNKTNNKTQDVDSVIKTENYISATGQRFKKHTYRSGHTTYIPVNDDEPMESESNNLKIDNPVASLVFCEMCNISIAPEKAITREIEGQGYDLCWHCAQDFLNVGF